MIPQPMRHGVDGEVQVPGDKSVSHRALILAALAAGRTNIRGILDAADIQSTAGVLRVLGVQVPRFEARDSRTEEFSIVGNGLRGLRPPAAALNCGNSGTTTRLMAGVCAAHPFTTRFVGDESLSRRPMQRIAEPLRAMGARVTFEGGDGLPLSVHGGALRSVVWENASGSAQVKSAILLAGLVAGVGVEVRAKRSSRDHTERFLRALGVSVLDEGGRVSLTPVRTIPAFDLDVPGDPSSAAFFAALAALAPRGCVTVRHVLMNSTRDGFFRSLRAFGAQVSTDMEGATASGEATATYHIRPAQLRGIVVGADDVPGMIDEIPLLACVASRAVGETVITGAAELRVKESDRIAATVSNLRAIGVEADERPDGLVVRGTDAPLKGLVRAYGDHRIAMAFGVLATLPGSAIEIDDPACVAISYPRFWTDLARISR